jgi:hypothetical protein
LWPPSGALGSLLAALLISVMPTVLVGTSSNELGFDWRPIAFVARAVSCGGVQSDPALAGTRPG